MTDRILPSAPTVEYGAPYLPITTTRRTDMNVAARSEHSSTGALDPQAAGELVARIAAADTNPTGPGEWLAHTLSSDTSGVHGTP